MADIIKHLKAIKPASWLKALLYGILITAIYYSALKVMILKDWAREDYSHSYLIPLVVLSLLLAYWFKAAFWKKALLVLSAIPLSIVVNSFRIAMTGILYSSWGARVAEDFFHGFSGWLIFMFTLPVLLLEMWVLNRGIGGRGSGIRDRGSGNRKRGKVH